MTLGETYSSIVERLLAECKEFYGERLVSLCLYGSVARETMNYASDVDFLLVVDRLPDGRISRVQEFSRVEDNLRSAMAAARQSGFFIEFSPVFKTPAEVRQGSLLFLDLLEDGKILFDKDAFLKSYLGSWGEKLRAQGARRVVKGETWYWILKDPYRVGEEIEL